MAAVGPGGWEDKPRVTVEEDTDFNDLSQLSGLTRPEIYNHYQKNTNNFDARTFDPRWKPPPDQQPIKRLRQVHTFILRFFRILGVWHFFHVIMAAAFMYFAIHYVDTAFPNGEPPLGCTTVNGTLIDYTTIADAQVAATCKSYEKWLILQESNWKRGVIVYSVFNGILAAVSLVYCYIVWRRVTALQPKNALAILQSVFTGFPKGSFMVSYAWRDEPQYGHATGELPRRVASFFPSAWLDIENLIPGTPVKETCKQAAQNALFRFAFISENYLSSPNCLVEWEQIRRADQAQRSFIFAYPGVKQSELEWLKSVGHLVVELNDDIRKELMEPEWFLNLMIRSRLCNPFFSCHSPGINEHWRPTLRFWFGEGDKVYLYIATPLIIGCICIVTIDLFVAYFYKFTTIFLGFEGCGVLFALALSLPGYLLLVGIYILWYLRGTGYSKTGLPDVVYLLIFLVKLGVIDPIKFYSNSPDVTHTPEFLIFQSTGVARLVDNVEEGDIKCLLLDDVEENKFTKEEVDDSFVFWTRNGFPKLTNYAKDTFGSHIIGDEVPGLEFLGCKMLMRAFNVAAADLTVGKGSFQTLFQRNRNPDDEKGIRGVFKRFKRCLVGEY